MWKSRESFYHSKEWKQKTEFIRQRDHGVCQHCNNRRVMEAYKRGEKHVKMIVHHKIWLTDENFNDRNISLGNDNLELVCIYCHNDIHEGNPCTVPGTKFNENGELIRD